MPCADGIQSKDGLGKERRRLRPRLYDDTSQDVERALVDGLRRLPPWRKLQMLAGLNSMVRELALVGLRQRHPHAGSEELQRRLADVLLGADLASAAYGPMDEH